MTELIGLVVVVISAAVFWPLLFGNRAEPATQPVRTQRGSPNPTQARRSPTTQPIPRRAEPTSLRVSPWVRLRGLVGLLLVCAGLAALIAVAVGAVVFFLGLKLQG